MLVPFLSDSLPKQMILLYSPHFWYVKHVKSLTVSYIFLKTEQKGRTPPPPQPFSSISASDPLTLILGRIWTTWILGPAVHQAVPSSSSATWQGNAPSCTCNAAPAGAPHVLCGTRSPCPGGETLGSPSSKCICFCSQGTESSWMNSKPVLSVLCTQTPQICEGRCGKTRDAQMANFGLANIAAGRESGPVRSQGGALGALCVSKLL